MISQNLVHKLDFLKEALANESKVIIMSKNENPLKYEAVDVSPEEEEQIFKNSSQNFYRMNSRRANSLTVNSSPRTSQLLRDYKPVDQPPKNQPKRSKALEPILKGTRRLDDNVASILSQT